MYRNLLTHRAVLALAALALGACHSVTEPAPHQSSEAQAAKLPTSKQVVKVRLARVHADGAQNVRAIWAR